VLIGPKALGDVPLLSTMAADLIALIQVISAVALLFWQAPAESHRFQWITPGAGFFAVSWLVFSIGMAAYLARAGNVNHVYGSLGAVIVLLV
jgi:membrane protein